MTSGLAAIEERDGRRRVRQSFTSDATEVVPLQAKL